MNEKQEKLLRELLEVLEKPFDLTDEEVMEVLNYLRTVGRENA